jgi:DNA-directed RNA polymerase I subunit RPA43
LDEYVFEHTSSADQNGAESDDESDVSDSEDEGEFGLHLGAGAGNVHEVGRWKGRKDGKLLGEGGRGVKFTVIG